MVNPSQNFTRSALLGGVLRVLLRVPLGAPGVPLGTPRPTATLVQPRLPDITLAILTRARQATAGRAGFAWSIPKPDTKHLGGKT